MAAKFILYHKSRYTFGDIKDAVVAISPAITQREEYNRFWQIYGKRISGQNPELLVFNLPSIPNNFINNFLIPQYTNIGEYIPREVNDTAPKWPNIGGSDQGVVVLVENTPKARKIYQEIMNKVSASMTFDALLNPDNYATFNVVQQRNSMFDEKILEFPGAIYEIIQMFKHAQTGEEIVPIMFMVGVILTKGHVFYKTGNEAWRIIKGKVRINCIVPAKEIELKTWKELAKRADEVLYKYNFEAYCKKLGKSWKGNPRRTGKYAAPRKQPPSNFIKGRRKRKLEK